MKTATLLLLFLTITTPSFTQIKKGQFLIGGSINFESTKNENAINPTYTSNNFFFSPAIGYFMVDQLAGGLRLDFSLYDSKSDNVETHSTATTISPFLRYYLLPVSKKVNAFIDVSYLHNKKKFSPGYSEKAKGYYLSAGPSIFLTEQIALEFTLGYKHTNSDNFGNTEVDIFNSGFGLQIHLGKLKKKPAAASVVPTMQK
jgi:hypothetical protein